MMMTFVARDRKLHEIARIRSEYQRRSVEVPCGFYGWDQAVNRFFHSQTYRACLHALAREGLLPLQGRSVADIGCGDGTWLLEFVQWGADPKDLSGIDLNESRVRRARQRLGSANLCAGHAGDLPWKDSKFDLITQFTLFTSVLDPIVKAGIADEMVRVLKPGGVMLWYDFRYNNPRNPNVRRIEEAEIRSLFPNCTVKLRRVTLAPPIARLVVPVSWMAALALEKLPFLRTHYLGIIRKSIR